MAKKTKKVKISTITIELAKGTIEMSIEDAKELHEQLSELFDSPAPIIIEKYRDNPVMWPSPLSPIPLKFGDGPFDRGPYCGNSIQDFFKKHGTQCEQNTGPTYSSFSQPMLKNCVAQG